MEVETTIKGKIEGADFKEGKKKDGKKWARIAFEVGGHTYSSFEKEHQDFKGGDFVEIEYKMDGKYRKIVNIKKTEEPLETISEEEINNGGEKPTFVDREVKIIRQSCLKVSCELMKIVYDKHEGLIDINDIKDRTIEMTKELVKWVNE